MQNLSFKIFVLLSQTTRKSNKGTILLLAQITNFSYQKCYKQSLQSFDCSEINKTKWKQPQ